LSKQAIFDECRARGFFTIREMAEVLGEMDREGGGDVRSYSNRYVHVHRARREGRFPGAEKLGTQTAGWIIPYAEAMVWLQMGAPRGKRGS
jgi:hypothetical protein